MTLRGLILWAAIAMGVAVGTGCKDSDADGVRDRKDCAPNDTLIHPEAREVCDGVDNDCDGHIDEDVAIVAYLDRDLDGFGDDAYVRRVCTMPSNGAERGGDCNDGNPDVYPEAPELCDTLDNDCDEVVDEDVTVTFYGDGDGDGHGDAADTVQACVPPPGYVVAADDCDDEEPLAWTDAPEACDGVDNDCNAEIDEGLEPVRQWTDADGDGYGDPNAPALACGPGDGVADNALDCDDTDPARSPDSREIRNNAFDEDCDGYVDEFGVGPNSEFATAEEALATAPNGSVIQFDDGFHVATVDLTGRDVILAGEGCDRTTLYGDAQGSTIIADAGRIERLTVSGGNGWEDPETSNRFGGGILVLGDVTISACVEANSAWRGGGVAVLAGTATIDGALISANSSSDHGGGVFVRQPASVAVYDSRIVANASNKSGGGMAFHGATGTVLNTVIAGNRAIKWGGGLFTENWIEEDVLVEAAVTVDQVTFHRNQGSASATASGAGEAVYAFAGTVSLHNVLVTGHPLPFILLHEATDGTIETSYVAYRGNAGPDVVYASWDPSRIAGDPAYVLDDPTLTAKQWDLRLRADSDLLDAGDPAILDPDGTVSQVGAFGGPSAPEGWDFGLVADDDADGMLDGWEVWRGTNRWIDDSADDDDADGLTHAEEFAAGSDPLLPDTDLDGLTDGSEAGVGTDPLDARDQAPMPATETVRYGIVGHPLLLDATGSYDPNGDALTYAWTVDERPATSTANVAAPSDASTSFTPDVAGTWVLGLEVDDGGTTRTTSVTVTVLEGIVVPDDAPTVQDAVDASGAGFAVAVRPGTWRGAVDVGSRDVVIVGLGPRDQVVLDGGGADSVLRTEGGSITAAHLTITGGYAEQGGGIRAYDADSIELVDVVVAGNRAVTGGGLYVQGNFTGVALTSTVIADNLAEGDGGGLWLLGEDNLDTLRIANGSFLGNVAGGNGGAMYVDGGTLEGEANFRLDGVTFLGNQAVDGAAFHMSGRGSDLNMFNLTMVGNRGQSLGWGDQGRIVIWADALARNEVALLFDADPSVDYRHFDGVWTDVPAQPFYTDADLPPFDTWVVADPRIGGFVDDGDWSNDLVGLRLGSPGFDRGFIDLQDPDGSRSDVGACGGLGAPATCGLGWLDADADGMADGWEAAVGLDPRAPDAVDDPDGDGLDNLTEHELGTRPLEADTDRDGVDDAAEAGGAGHPLDDRDHRPVAVVAADVVVAEVGQTAVLDGTGSFDPDGEAIDGYTWRVVGIAAGSSVTTADLVGADTATATFVPDAPGAFRIGLVAEAGSARSRERIVWVVVPFERHVPDDYATVDEALEAARDHDVVVLGAGTWPVQLSIENQPITIAGVGADQTVLESVGLDEAIVVLDADDDVRLRDLTLTGGAGSNGAAIYCNDARLGLERVVARRNVAKYGPGAYLYDCDTTITDSWFHENRASTRGGAVYVIEGTLRWTGGGATDNSSGYTGGVAYLQSVDAELRNLVLVGNQSLDVGGAIDVYEIGSPDVWVVLDHLTVAGNRGVGGAIHRSGSVPHPLAVTNTLLLDNQEYGFFDEHSGAIDLDLHHNAWWGNGFDSTPPEVSAGQTDVLADPRVIAYQGAPTDDLRLRDHSPLRDAGDGFDPDGSVADIGAWGGPDAPADWDLYFRDVDQDGMADGWEAEVGLDPADPGDATPDPDGDTLSNLAESAVKSDPFTVDSDLDGVDDGAEVGGGTDPAEPGDHAPSAVAGPDQVIALGGSAVVTGSGVDPQDDAVTFAWSLVAAPGRSQLGTEDLIGADTPTVTLIPEVPGRYVLQLVTSDGVGFSRPDTVDVRVIGEILVPEDYPTLREAVDAAADGSAIRIGAGTFAAGLDLGARDLALIGAGRDLTVLDGEGRDSVLTAVASPSLVLEGLTLTGGLGGRGGGLWLYDTTATLVDVALAGSVACEGGGLYSELSDVVATGLRVVDNAAGCWAGGIDLVGTGSFDLLHGLIAGNETPSWGGGFRIYGNNVSVANAVLSDNLARQGGGAYVDKLGSEAVFEHVTATYNTVTEKGAFLLVRNSATAEVVDSVVAHNRGPSTVEEQTGAFSTTLRYTLVSQNDDPAIVMAGSPMPVDGVDGMDLDGDPALTGASEDGDWTNDDWGLGLGSAAIDAADPLGPLDADGSLPDMGAFGGADGAWAP